MKGEEVILRAHLEGGGEGEKEKKEREQEGSRGARE